MLDLWSLRILVAVADRGSFSAAAGELVLTQPAVSRQVAGLEKRLGVALFHRVPRGVTPTTAGVTAVELARQVLHRLDAMEATMRALTGLEDGHLRLSGFPSANTRFLPEAIRRFSAEHPGVTVTLLHVDPWAALDAVTSGQVDLALLTGWQLYADPDRARHQPGAAALHRGVADVELVPLLDEELHVGLPADHPLADQSTVRLSDLRDETWVEGAHPDCLGPLSELAAALGGPPRIGFTCHDWNGKQALVAGGAGIMLVPQLAHGAIGPGILLRPTDPALPARRLYAAVHHPPFRSPATEAMLALLPTLLPTPAPTPAPA
jgi:DNA-binding transcriptional LysR family regulator